MGTKAHGTVSGGARSWADSGVVYVEIKGSRRPSWWQRVCGIAVVLGVKGGQSPSGPLPGDGYPDDVLAGAPQRRCYRVVYEEWPGVLDLVSVRAYYRRQRGKHK